MKKIIINILWIIWEIPMKLGGASVWEWERLQEAKCELGFHNWNMFSNRTLCNFCDKKYYDIS